MDIAKQIRSDIDAFCVESMDDGFRSHLGASQIGELCKRKLWYAFRWCKREKFNGRMHRLLKRGHFEEPRFVSYLRGIGCEVWETDPNTGKQWRINGVDGHFGGSCDGAARLPERYSFASPVLLEFKTHGTGAGFSNLIKNGFVAQKPMHWAQTCTYGYKLNLSHVVYVSVNKNDDDLHVEFQPLDLKLGEQMEMKARQIIYMEKEPERLSNNPTHFECKFCHAKPLCHGDEQPERNCRSCSNATPIADAQWSCKKYGTIPKEYIRLGCVEWRSVCDK